MSFRKIPIKRISENIIMALCAIPMLVLFVVVIYSFFHRMPLQ